MDEGDRAKRYEGADRKAALAAQKARAEAEDSERPRFIDGVACCRDCEEPIEKERLAARPNAARCLACKTALERRRTRYGD